MSRRQISFCDSSGLVPLWFVVYCTPTEDQWNVGNVEIYSDSTLTLDALLADDAWSRLPRPSQDAIHAKLDEIEHERRQIQRERVLRLKAELAAVMS